MSLVVRILLDANVLLCSYPYWMLMCCFYWALMYCFYLSLVLICFFVRICHVFWCAALCVWLQTKPVKLFQLMSPIFSSNFNVLCCFRKVINVRFAAVSCLLWDRVVSTASFLSHSLLCCILWFYISAGLTLDVAATWAARLRSYSKGPVFQCRPCDRLS